MKDAKPQSTYWNLLDGWTLLAVEGPQARNFLQGQITCDLMNLAPNLSRLGAHCTPKGRMLFSFRVLAENEQRFLLRLPCSMLEIAQKSLGKYLAFFKAEQRSMTGVIVQRGMAGPLARSLLTKHLGAPAADAGHWVSCADQQILTLDEQRFECWLTPEEAQRLDVLFAEHTNSDGNNFWRLLDIRAGWGEVLPETSEAFIPQTLNYQLLEGVSFQKGCYTGQEVVARLHYRGKLKRHMYRIGFSWPENQPLPSAGMQLPASGELDQSGAGECVSAARADSSNVEALVVLSENDLKSDQLASNTQKLHILPLPYAIPSESQDSLSAE